MWPKLRHHEVQHALWTSKQRFSIVVAGRGSGKTELARRRVVRYLAVQKPWPNPQYFYALPTYGQAKRVAWDPIIALIPPHWIKNASVSSLSIETVFGSKLYIVGMDKPQRIEGTQWDGGIIDEASDQQPKVFDLSVRPALSHRKGWCWTIGVPKRFGIGASDFKKKFLEGQKDTDPDVDSYTWPSEDILTLDEILAARRQLDDQDYEEQYRASWLNVRGVVYHSFSEIFNITDQATYNPTLPIIVGSDFNVDPMSWALTQTIPNGLRAFDEVRIKNTNTLETLGRLYERYADHKSGWLFMGDASGRARKTSATSSDYTQIKSDERFVNKRMMYTTSNPAVADRNASVNALLCNAAKERRLIVHPRCKALIHDLGHLSYKPNTREIALGPGMGHMSDALGYIVHRLYPIRTDSTITSSMVAS